MAGLQQDTCEVTRQKMKTILCEELCKEPNRQDQELIFQCQLALREFGQDEMHSDVKFDLEQVSDCGEFDLARMERLRANGWWLPGQNTRAGVFRSIGKVAAVMLALLLVGAATQVGSPTAAGDVIFRAVQGWRDGTIVTQRIPNTEEPVTFDGVERYLEDPTGTLAIPQTLPDGYAYDGEITTVELGWGYMLTVSYLTAEGESIVLSVGIPKTNEPVVFGGETDGEDTEPYTINGIAFLFYDDLGLNKCQWRVGANEYMLQSTASVETIKEFLTFIQQS